MAARLASGEKPNRLIAEKSPYLLQHAFNPVDWYPWGPEAFEKASVEDKPVFLSVGYSTCYWCHVMEREVFENPAIASLMNELVVSVKVDREERPDVDRIYMSAVQAMSGAGGWPMSVFMTPGRNPFFGATYIPPVPSHGRPGFPDLLRRVAELWRDERERILESGDRVAEALASPAQHTAEPGPVLELCRKAADHFTEAYDPHYGGFGGAPKFPRPAILTFLFSAAARPELAPDTTIVHQTLRAMAAGGIFDHVGGGFHRYSVDREWRVPHFEKMLYDQAQLAVAYLEAFRLTGDRLFRRVAEDVLDYASSVLRDPAGAFYSAEDAESAAGPGGEKEEGAFYLWTLRETLDLLGDERGRMFAARYGMTEAGNAPHDPMNAFLGMNILYEAVDIEEVANTFSLTPAEAETSLHNCLLRLRQARSARPRPHLDDKIIAAWNGLMISACARAYQVLGDPKYLTLAESAAAFVLNEMTDRTTGRLFRRYRAGEAKFEGGLQDYAFVVQGLIDLYESNFDENILRRAAGFTELQTTLFRDPADGGLFDTPAGDPTLIFRAREDYDGAEPAGSSVAAMNLHRLARLCDKPGWRDLAVGIVRSVTGRIGGRPDSAPALLAAALWAETDPVEIIFSGDPRHPAGASLLDEIRRRSLPFSVVMARPGRWEDDSPLPAFLRDYEYAAAKPVVYVCRNYSCLLPTGDPAALGAILDESPSTGSRPAGDEL